MWKQEDKYDGCCHNDGCESYDNCTECWDSWAEYNPPMTNADHIRAMTDEELSWFLGRDISGCMRETPTCEVTLSCRECFLNWLKQPYGGAEHEHKAM